MNNPLPLIKKTFIITGKTDCDVTFSNHLISRQTASANNTSMTLPVLRKTFRVKAHVQPTQCYARRHKMKLDTRAQVSYGVNDMSSDRMQEEEFVVNSLLLVSIFYVTCLYGGWINSDGLETYANGCVTADGSVNHKYLSSHNHKPEAGQGCLLDTLRHKTDKYNDQQPLTICSQHERACKRTLSDPQNVTGDPNSGIRCHWRCARILF